ncbi:MAG TPA: GAF domain-containing protein [Burkholderiales bacterium]|nr:GAF domain-containing protein [Burkholderiales bacterium]
MQYAPEPSNESLRIAALRAIVVDDTLPEERFDRIVQFAAVEFDAPIVAITLVDAQYREFKAHVGLDGYGGPRDLSFISQAVLEPDMLVVVDAHFDARFADNPLVTGAPHLRSYAGAPLRTPAGEVLGVLCLIDTKPRGLDEFERAILRTLRDLTVNELTHTPVVRAAGCSDVLASTAKLSTLLPHQMPAGQDGAQAGV